MQLTAIERVLLSIHELEPELPVIHEDQLYKGEFFFTEAAYGLDVHANTIIVALVRRDQHEASNYEDYLEYSAREEERLRQERSWSEEFEF